MQNELYGQLSHPQELFHHRLPMLAKKGGIIKHRLTLRSRTLFTRTSFFCNLFFSKKSTSNDDCGSKMRFKQKFWHRWKALGLNFLKQRGHFCSKRSGFELWPADGSRFIALSEHISFEPYSSIVFSFKVWLFT